MCVHPTEPTALRQTTKNNKRDDLFFAVFLRRFRPIDCVHRFPSLDFTLIVLQDHFRMVPPTKRSRSGGEAPVSKQAAPYGASRNACDLQSSSCRSGGLAAVPEKKINTSTTSAVVTRSVCPSTGAPATNIHRAPPPGRGMVASSRVKSTPSQPKLSPLDIQLRARLEDVQGQRRQADAILAALQDVCNVHGPDIIEALVDEQAQQRDMLRNAPDPLNTDETLQKLNDACEGLARDAVRLIETRDELLGMLDRTHEEIVVANEDVEMATASLNALAKPLADATELSKEWDAKLSQLRDALTLERDSTYGLSAEAAALLKESERLQASKKDLDRRATETEIERRIAHSTYEELKGTIRVYCRIKGGASTSGPAAPASDAACVGNAFRQPQDVLCSNPLDFPPSVVDDEPDRPSSSSSTSLAASDGTAASGLHRARHHAKLTTTTGEADFGYPDRDSDRRLITVQSSRLNATSTGMRRVLVSHQYDRVFAPSDSQEDIFEHVGPLVDCAIDGFRVCILAYGQTGSGKTYTMEGDVQSEQGMGIIPRAIRRMFERREALKSDGWKYKFTCFFVEIYNDHIRDLLETNEQYHKAFFSADQAQSAGGGGGGYVQSLGTTAAAQHHRPQHDILHKGKVDTLITNVKERTVRTVEDVMALLEISVKNRSVAKTAMNERSSRSHCVFTIRMEGAHDGLQQRSLGNLCLVDLAGSERVAESAVQGAQLKEAVNINKSLSFLGDCIGALSLKKVVPWRNCKLTWLLQNYLGGDGAKVLMLVTVCNKEEHVPETLNSMRFAAKVNQTVIPAAQRRVAS